MKRLKLLVSSAGNLFTGWFTLQDNLIPQPIDDEGGEIKPNLMG